MLADVGHGSIDVDTSLIGGFSRTDVEIQFSNERPTQRTCAQSFIHVHVSGFAATPPADLGDTGSEEWIRSVHAR